MTRHPVILVIGILSALVAACSKPPPQINRSRVPRSACSWTRCRRNAGSETATCSCSAPKSWAPTSGRGRRRRRRETAAACQSLLDRGVQALVVIPHSAEGAAPIVAAAKKRSVGVISYDRLILNADVDLYLSYDNRMVGEQQAQYLRNRAPTGNYILLGGATTDYNAKLIREGQMAALEDAVKRGDIKIVADPWTPNWKADAAREAHDGGAEESPNKVVAIVASTTTPPEGPSRRSKRTGWPARSSSPARTPTWTLFGASSRARRP